MPLESSATVEYVCYVLLAFLNLKTDSGLSASNVHGNE